MMMKFFFMNITTMGHTFGSAWNLNPLERLQSWVPQ